jgi:2-keto-4-pentenoate hydratase/2-oxohepta-3-ene-1,7-dioic acid hydratase in catechol pathway
VDIEKNPVEWEAGAFKFGGTDRARVSLVERHHDFCRSCTLSHWSSFMRIVTYNRNGSVHYGTRIGNRIRIHPSATSAIDLAVNGADHPASEEIALSGVTLLAPVLRPGKVVCIGLNYRAHAKEGGNPIPDYPAAFLRGATSLVGPGADIFYPKCSDKLDYEAELAVIIGKSATDVGVNALDYVAGYTCFNDGSVRDYQRKSSQWTLGKNFDRTGGFGPEIVTPDELPAGAKGLRIVARLNGQTMQESNTSDMIFDVSTLIATLSEAMTLEPGDVIATGTPSGVGYARTPPVFLRVGDRIEVEIERIGILANTVAPRAASSF